MNVHNVDPLNRWKLLPLHLSAAPLMLVFSLVVRDVLGLPPISLLADNSDQIAYIFDLTTLVAMGCLLHTVWAQARQLFKTPYAGLCASAIAVVLHKIASFIAAIVMNKHFSTQFYTIVITSLLRDAFCRILESPAANLMLELHLSYFMLFITPLTYIGRILMPTATVVYSLVELLVIVGVQIVLLVKKPQDRVRSWFYVAIVPQVLKCLLGLFEVTFNYGSLIPSFCDLLSILMTYAGMAKPIFENARHYFGKKRKMSELSYKAQELLDRLALSFPTKGRRTSDPAMRNYAIEFVEMISVLAKVLRDLSQPMISNGDLLRGSNLPPEQKQWVNGMVESTELLLTTVQNTVEFAKAEYGLTVLDKAASFRPEDVIEQVLDNETISKSLEQLKDVEVFCLIEPDVPNRLFGDGRVIEIILGHLLRNSIKYTKRGEITITVRTDRASINEYMLSFIVEDTGLGIGKNVLENIRNPFRAKIYTSDRSGSGLGIPICDRLARLFEQGSLQIDSVLNRGTKVCFSALFKAYPPQQQKRTRLMAPILFVGTVKQAHCYSSVMERFGYSFTATSSLDEACVLINKANYTYESYKYIVINDKVPMQKHGTSVCDATEAVRIIDKIAGRNYVPVVLAQLSEVEYYKTQQASFAAVLVKPFRVKLFKAMLDKVDAVYYPEHKAPHELPLMPLSIKGESADVSPMTITTDTAPPSPSMDIISGSKAQVADILAEPEAKTPQEPAVGGEPTCCLNVMVVEDNELTRKVLHDIVKRCGHRCWDASNGFEALNLFKAHKFDVIFMDLYMPVLDGIKATMRIRDIETKSLGSGHCAIIGITAEDATHSQQECISAGMDMYMVKPVSTKFVEDALSKIAAEKEGQKNMKTSQQPSRPLRVLLADDNHSFVTVAQRVLEARGIEVDVVSNGAEAFDRVKSRHDYYDVILLDILMPIMDGIQCAVKIRQMEAVNGWSPLPIIALTGTANTPDEAVKHRNQCVEAGFTDFLQKPLDYPRLIQLLENLNVNK